MDRVGASAQAIADALAPTPQAPSARWRWGTVATVNPDGTMNVSIGGSTVAGVRCAQHVMGAKVGDRVRVLYCGTEAMVDAVRASDRLMSLPIISSAILLKDERLDRDGTAPSSNTYSRIVGIQDKDGENVAYIQAAQYTDGRTGCIINAYNEKSDGTAVGNTINVMVAKDGTRSYSVTDAAAFRNAINSAGVSNQSAQNVVFSASSGAERVQTIGFNVTNESHALSGKRLALLLRSNGIDLYNSTDSSYIWQYRVTESTTTASSIFTASSGFTAGTCAYSSRLGIAHLVLQVTTTSALTANTTYTVGTIASGKRPAQIAAMSERVGTSTHGKVEIATNGTVTYRPTQAVSANYTCVFHTAVYIVG